MTVKHKASSEETVPKGDSFKIKTNDEALSALQQGCVVGGVSWLWADDKLMDQLDYLFVDEAGQMSLANALAVSRATRNLVLLGDPQQLEQPQKGAHPEGSDVSALQHIIGEHQTIPSDRGIFLDTTWRLNPKIASFTSEIYYESRLKARDGSCQSGDHRKLPVQRRGPVLYSGGSLRETKIAHLKRLLKLSVWSTIFPNPD